MERADIDRIIEMAWEDRTPFEAIYSQFQYSEKDVIALMRSELKGSSFRLWRQRVASGGGKKHARKRPAGITRFRSSMQRTITGNKISKR